MVRYDKNAVFKQSISQRITLTLHQPLVGNDKFELFSINDLYYPENKSSLLNFANMTMFPFDTPTIMRNMQLTKQMSAHIMQTFDAGMKIVKQKMQIQTYVCISIAY